MFTWYTSLYLSDNIFLGDSMNTLHTLLADLALVVCGSDWYILSRLAMSGWAIKEEVV